MKKLFLVCFTLLIIIPIFAKAETCNNNEIVIKSITRELSSESLIEKNKPVINGSVVTLDLDFTEIGDHIKYKILVSNESKEDFTLNEDKITTNTNYVNYDLEPLDNSNTIKAGESKEFYLSIEYKNKVDPSNYTGNTYNDSKEFSLNLIGVEPNVPNPETGLNNPLVKIAIVLVIGLSLYFVLKRNKYKRFMVLIGLILLPITINAICKCNINIKSNVNINKNNYLYTTSTNIYYVNNTINSGDPVYHSSSQALDSFDHNFFIRHSMDEENKIISSYVGYIKDGKFYYIPGGNDGNHYTDAKEELLKVFGEDNCTELNNNFVCKDSHSKLEVIIGNDGYVEAGDQEMLCVINTDNGSHCFDSIG